jgi:NAD(P)H-hydrate epimerase
MENAARGVAEVAASLGAEFVILCGPGNNGGDGLAAARHLGPAARVHLLAEPDPERAPDAALQLRILRAAGWSITADPRPPGPAAAGAVWIDALYGTGLTRAIEGPAVAWIEAMQRAAGPKLAVDVPSGLDADLGLPTGPACVRADVTVTFEAPKRGLVEPAARAFVGRLVVAPLGLPRPRS